MAACKMKSFYFGQFDGGLNPDALPTNIKHNELNDCQNMYYDNGMLLTRAGVMNTSNTEIDTAGDYEIVPIGSTVYGDDVAVKLFFASKKLTNGFRCKFIVVKSDSSVNTIDIGDFKKADYQNGISKLQCISFSGTSVVGCGVFAIISVFNDSSKICDKFICEFLDGFLKFKYVSVNSIYAPLISVNGRGQNYSDLLVSERDLPAPKRVEDFNMLSSAFRCAFTTDGLSTAFYLPAKKLSSEVDENIIITYTNDNGVDFTWNIAYDKTDSAAVTVDSVDYIFKVNRKKGNITSYGSDGKQLALPKTYGVHNNLLVKAFKAPPNNNLFEMTVAHSLNSRVFLSGCDKQANAIWFSKQNNPLYFPQSNVSYFGDKSANITAMKQQNDRLVIFKAHQVGICSAVSFSEYNVDSILSGKSSGSSTDEKMVIKSINTGIGCKYPDTVLNCANRLVFLGSDKRVYAITSTSNYLQRFYRISDKIESKLFAAPINKNAYALDYSGKYMLFLDNRCFSFDYNSPAFLSASSASGSSSQLNKIAWFYFVYKFGIAKPFSAMSIGNKAIIISSAAASSGVKRVLCYTFSSEYDDELISETEFSPAKIKSSFMTGVDLGLPEYGKRIVGLEITFGADSFLSDDDINLFYYDENNSYYIGTVSLNGIQRAEAIVKKIPCFASVRYFGIGLDRNSVFSIKNIRVIYKQLGQF